MNPYKLRIGLDVGSTTAKIAVLDAEGRLMYSNYERHNAKVNILVEKYLNELIERFGDVPAIFTVTGSVGMATAEQLQCNFVQEVIAASEYSKKVHPEAKALIDIGGEDAKVVFFNGKNTDLRMNGNCAGGTGAFIDQMSLLMGIDNTEMSRLAMKAERIHPIAARCGVFSKTDIQNLMARNIPAEEIAASIFHAIAVQTVTSLSHGCSIEAPILLCGGPLTFLPALRKAFFDYLGMSEDDFLFAVDPISTSTDDTETATAALANGSLVPAMGCAFRSGEHNQAPRLLSQFLKLLTQPINVTFSSEQQPLFSSEEELHEWQKEKMMSALPVKQFSEGRQQIVIGIDSGSTTTKIIAADAGGNVFFKYYAPNLGNPINAAKEGLMLLQKEAAAHGTALEVIGSCSTGYGEDLIKAAFNLNEGIIETMAHYRAANALMPGVSFILDIGGQDMKAIFVEDGVVVRMELNEACSSGCGTFISTFATSLGYKVEDFARIACTAKSPCDLGTRCTVFMNSKVKQMLREGATIADISAGLAYSVIRNCLFKVLKFKHNDELGGKVVVQGGTMRNDSVVRAFEVLTHQTVVRSDCPELMGAYGCALQAAVNLAQSYTTIEEMLSTAVYETKHQQCKGCENKCFVSRYTFNGGNRFYSGNKCEKVFSNKGAECDKGENIYVYKNQLLFDRPMVKEPTPITFGIPRVLNMYENYPFWNALLNNCGFNVMLSHQSTFVSYEGALNCVMSDNICFPAKLVHSHIADLCSKGVDRILMPYVVYEHKEDPRTHNSYNCPIVSGYSEVVKSSQQPSVPIDTPVITFADDALLRKQLERYLSQFGVSKDIIHTAISDAIAQQQKYMADIQRRAQSIYENSKREGKITILLAGRPYHSDFLIQHKLSEMIASLGVNVISDDIVRGNESVDISGTYLVRQWAYMNRIVKAAQWAADHDDTVHFVQMTSFGCGPDAFLLDEVRDILRRSGKPFTMLKIDDVNNIGSLNLRVRSLVESLRYHGLTELKIKNSKFTNNQQPTIKNQKHEFPVTRPYRAADKAQRKLLIPYFTQYLSPVLPPILRLSGFDAEVLPLSDGESADLGLKYANNEVCYPATLIVGDIIKALKSGKYNRDRIAIVMSQTGGQCRATNYLGLIKRAMIAAGFKDVPVVAFGTMGAVFNDQQGFDIDWKKIIHTTVNAIFFTDALSRMYHSAVVREKEKGIALRLREEYMQKAIDAINDNKPGMLVKLIRSAAKDYDDAVTDCQRKKVGIVGEIFLKFNPFAHQFIARWFIDHDIEVVPPILFPFFLQEFVNYKTNQQLNLIPSNKKTSILLRLAYSLISMERKRFNRAASEYRYFTKFSDVFDDAARISDTVSLAGQFGEGWLLPADIAAYYEEGVKNVVSLQPFGCIANQIVSKGIEKKMHQRYTDLNLLSLDFDGGVSATNVTNRLMLFIESLA